MWSDLTDLFLPAFWETLAMVGVSGGIGALAPTRKSDLARMGLRAVAAGTMANFMSACIAGMLL